MAEEASTDETTDAERAASVRQLTKKNVDAVRKLQDAAQARRTLGDRVADTVTRFCGSTAFVWIHIVWFAGWITLNSMKRFGLEFDPYPYQLLTLVVSLEAIFLSTFVLISQNRQQLLSDRRNHLDLQINLLSEQENTAMLRMLQTLVDHFGLEVEGAKDIRVMEKATRPELLAEQIDAELEEDESTHGKQGKRPKY
ncbi:MAG: DUF1003 domain-containing protein [Polyangiales bacterium]